AISGGLEHQPFCSHAVIEKLDDDYSIKQAIQLCSLYPLDSPDIRTEIKEKLNATHRNDKMFILAKN
ncbi:MAG: hypothetical protein ACI9W6_001431, partial [Motiliproteus sp.]